MINRIRSRTGGYKNGVANTVKYQLKTNPTDENDSFESSIPRVEGESDWEYAKRVERAFEAARVPNQKQLYQHNTLSFHPEESKGLSNKQIMEIAKEFYLKEGLGDKNRHYVFVVERDTKHAHVHAAIHLTDLESKRVNNKMVNYNPIANRLEKKYGLYQVDRSPNPFNDNEPKKDKKKEFKDDLNSLMKNTSTASSFLFAANAAGYEILHNGNSAYSLEKDGETFKASDLGLSYKSLKAHFGEDSEFPSTLARLGKKTAPKRQMGSLAGPQFTDSSSDELKEAKKNLRQTLYTRFESDDGKSFRYKNSRYEAFHFANNTITFNAISPQVLKAGLQKMIEEGNQSIHIRSDSKAFKRETWYQFHLMGLAEKGYKLYGYEPSEYDHQMLEKRKREQNSKFNNGSLLSTAAQKTNAEIEKSKQEVRKETQSVRQEIQRTKQEIEKAKYEIERTKIDAKTEEVKEKKEVKSLQTSAMQVGKGSKANKMKMNDNSEDSKSDSSVNKEMNKAAPSGSGAQAQKEQETHSDGEDALNLICASSPWNLLNVKMSEMEATRSIAESKRRDMEGKEETVKKHLKNKPRPQ